MPLNPPLRAAPRFPVTSLIAIASIALSLRWWLAHSLSGCVPSGSVLAEPWTLITCILPHGNVIHLAFNLYWWWYFATRLEHVWGGAKLLGAVRTVAKPFRLEKMLAVVDQELDRGSR